METLYHYCSTASFHAIIQSRALWLSSLSLSNDTMEGKLVASSIARLAERESLEYERVRLLQRGIGFLEETIGGMGFCLSEQGDLLSQWRGYAGNATGVAIGFSKEYLERLANGKRLQDNPGCILRKVEYDLSAHEARVKPTYRKVTQLFKDGTLKSGQKLGLVQTVGLTDQELLAADIDTSQQELVKVIPKLLSLLLQLFVLKSPAFREEQEWRVLSMLITDGEELCSHRFVNNSIVPYLTVKLVELDQSPILEVILGPKHGTPPKIVETS
jgi:Protein of unknown function (DUF2971)